MILQAVRRYQQVFRVLDGLPHAKCIEDPTCFHADFRTGSHQRIVRINFRSFLVVVARSNLCDIRNRIANFPCNQAQFRVYLEVIQTIDNPAASFFQSSWPFNIVFFVKSGTQFHQYNDIFSVFCGFNQRFYDFAVGCNPIQGHFNGNDIGVFAGFVEQVQEWTNAFKWEW